MRVLTTAIDKGEHKVPGEKHKCTLYALAPGDALEINDETREHTPRKVTPEVARKATYLYLLRWIDGRTVAMFDVNGKVYVQPTRPDPAPKRRRDAAESVSHEGAEDPIRSKPPSADAGNVTDRRRRAGRRGAIGLLGESDEPDQVVRGSMGERSAGAGPKKKKRKFRRRLVKLDLL